MLFWQSLLPEMVSMWQPIYHEEAFQNPKDDPVYRKQMLAVIRRNVTSPVAPAPDSSLVITAGALTKDYKADGRSVCNESEFYARFQNSFYKAEKAAYGRVPCETAGGKADSERVIRKERG